MANSFLNTTATMNQNLGTDGALFYTQIQKRVRTTLRASMKEMIFRKYAMKITMPKNSGDEAETQRMEKIELSTTPLDEGVTPDSNVEIRYTAVKIKCYEYGDWAELSKRLNVLAVNPPLERAVLEFSLAANEALDKITRTALLEGGSEIFAGNKTKVEEITASDLKTFAHYRLARRTMYNAYIDTPNGSRYYPVICHPDEIDYLIDTEQANKFQQYGMTNQLIKENTLTVMYGLEFHTTRLMPIFNGAEGTKVYPSIVFGHESYAVTDITGLGNVNVW